MSPIVLTPEQMQVAAGGVAGGTPGAATKGRPELIYYRGLDGKDRAYFKLLPGGGVERLIDSPL